MGLSTTRVLEEQQSLQGLPTGVTGRAFCLSGSSFGGFSLSEHVLALCH